VLYFAAGRSSHLDGGIYLYGLDPASGRELCRTKVESGRNDVMNQNKPLPAGGLSDVLVSDGQRIFMRNLAFDLSLKPAAAPGAQGSGGEPRNRLSAWGGLLDDNAWNRAFWVYAPEWPTHYANQAPKAGQLLTFGRSTTYAVKYFTKRNYHSPMFFPAESGYLLFADDNLTQPRLYDGGPESPKPVKWLPPVAESQEFECDRPVTKDPRDTGYIRTKAPRWMKYLPIRVRAMVATKDRIYVAGPPDVLKEGDELAALEGRAGGRLRVVDAASGETISEIGLKSPPVFDGMIAAFGRIYLATEDGSVICLEGE
jgi:hypothetical protein